MKIPADALRNVISARGLDISTLAERSGVPVKAINRVLADVGDLDDEQIFTIAEQLAVPVQALLARQSLPLFPPVDFRTADPHVGEFDVGTLKAISFVEKLSSAFSALRLEIPLDTQLARVETDLSTQRAIELASHWRKLWGISIDEQLTWQDSNKVYVSLRSFIEGLGIVVMHRPFGTDEAAGIYVHVGGGPHTVLINTTKSSKARKLFTLAHEFCHVMLRAEGASNPSVLKNKIERFCNKFAAYLLAPKALINEGLLRFRYSPSSDQDFIRLFAKKLGISQEALFLRLVEIGHLDRTAYVSWKARFSGGVPIGDTTDGGGGQSDPLQTKRTMYGSALLGLLGQAKRLGQLDEIDIYRLSGLKPRFQEQLLGAA